MSRRDGDRTKLARSLFIVTKERPGLFAYARKDFANDADVEVIMDRRVSERRRMSGCAPDDRRRSMDRRVRQDVPQQLVTLGFAIVHAEELGTPLPA